MPASFTRPIAYPYKHLLALYPTGGDVICLNPVTMVTVVKRKRAGAESS
jgi:hypothetical protein